jgi:hypothetical protein
MKAVWSLWTKPLTLGHSAWPTEQHHLMAWVASVAIAKRHFSKIALVTDRVGADLLVEKLGLAFDEVIVELDALNHYEPQWWGLAKVWAYRIQTEPFIHIDSDVFLWQPLPDRMVSAPLLAQNPDYFTWLDPTTWYEPEAFEVPIYAVDGWLPQEWIWQRTQRLTQKGFCCGIFGGNAVDFIQYYADLAMRLVNHPANQPAWPLLKPDLLPGLLFEEYLLGCCTEYHTYHPTSPFSDLTVQCLFSSLEEAFQPGEANQVGYTHLISGAKKNPVYMKRLETWVQKHCPEKYEQIQKITKTA